MIPRAQMQTAGTRQWATLTFDLAFR